MDGGVKPYTTEEADHLRRNRDTMPVDHDRNCATVEALAEARAEVERLRVARVRTFEEIEGLRNLEQKAQAEVERLRATDTLRAATLSATVARAAWFRYEATYQSDRAEKAEQRLESAAREAWKAGHADACAGPDRFHDCDAELSDADVARILAAVKGGGR